MCSSFKLWVLLFGAFMFVFSNLLCNDKKEKALLMNSILKYISSRFYKWKQIPLVFASVKDKKLLFIVFRLLKCYKKLYSL